jgi:hypothetical protein
VPARQFPPLREVSAKFHFERRQVGKSHAPLAGAPVQPDQQTLAPRHQDLEIGDQRPDGTAELDRLSESGNPPVDLREVGAHLTL